LDISNLQTANDYQGQKESISKTFDYWIESPFECITEIGLSVLKQEYVFQLVSIMYIILDQNLCNWNDVQIFLESGIEYHDQISNLKRLHMVLEIATLLSSNVLALSFETIRDVTKKILLYVQPGNSIKNHVQLCISLPLFYPCSTKLFETFGKRFEPNEWFVQFQDENTRGFFGLKKCEHHGEDVTLEQFIWKAEFGRMMKISAQSDN
jgi:hypothetical protein